MLLIVAGGFVAVPVIIHSNLAFDGSANAALASLLALHWRPCCHCTGIIVSIALLLLLALRRRGCPCCMGVITLIVLELLPLLHPRCCQHCKLASTQSGFSRNMSVLVALLPSLPMASSSYPALFLRNLAFGGPANAVLCWSPCLYCAGVIASIVLSSLLALHQHCCLVVRASLPSLHPLCHQHCKLASAESRCSRDTSACVSSLPCFLSSPVAFLP
jgi:hypothetical protein